MGQQANASGSLDPMVALTKLASQVDRDLPYRQTSCRINRVADGTTSERKTLKPKLKQAERSDILLPEPVESTPTDLQPERNIGSMEKKHVADCSGTEFKKSLECEVGSATERRMENTEDGALELPPCRAVSWETSSTCQLKSKNSDPGRVWTFDDVDMSTEEGLNEKGGTQGIRMEMIAEGMDLDWSTKGDMDEPTIIRSWGGIEEMHAETKDSIIINDDSEMRSADSEDDQSLELRVEVKLQSEKGNLTSDNNDESLSISEGGEKLSAEALDITESQNAETTSHNQLNPKAKKRRMKSLLDFVEVKNKIDGVGASTSLAQCADNRNRKNTKTSDWRKKVTEVTEAKVDLDCRNVLCPVQGCGNMGGRGFGRVGLSKHLMGKHFAELVKSSPNYDSI